MDQFECIVIPEPDSRLRPFANRLKQWATRVRTFDAPIADEDDLIDRVRASDAILPMGGTQLTARVIESAAALRYIGLGATLFTGPHSNIDVDQANARGIPVTGVRDYGDIGVAEWVAAEAVRFIKQPEINGELGGTTVGVIGAGAAGGLTGRMLQGMGAVLRYYSRSRKPDVEADGIEYRDLSDLLAECTIVSIHVPRHTSILGARELDRFGSGKLLINTSVGLPVDSAALRAWLQDPANRFAADVEGIGDLKGEASTHPRISYYPGTTGYTAQAADRLYAEVERQLVAFLRSSSR